AAKIVGDKLFGRGAADMKCAIACFMQAACEFITKNPQPNFGIGFLITNDEENDSINGTKKVLQWMKNRFPISACIVGEPTNPQFLGEMLKIGRRGSINFEVKIIGKQGHVAYPQSAINPNTTMVNLLQILKNHKFDEGNEFFSPTNLEITNICSENLGNNVISSIVIANFNVRFNSLQTAQTIIDLVDYSCKKTVLVLGSQYELNYKTSGEAFLSKKSEFADLVQNSVAKITGKTPIFSTVGGTSDARFIKDYCQNVIEFGLINDTAHKIDEFAFLEDIKKLQEIYSEILRKF
ncbi:MAG TPA: succinyl-diaminopimelate desuccinylase, partial [Rickettsiales bacterium]|nr:succinyl-diaminopimelate desuccinylase [Rickettsiales bacterium]